MQKRQPENPTRQTVDVPKATWHRPTITFVTLQTTANDVGSGLDGGTISEVG